MKDFTFSVSGIENISEEDMNKLSALIINRRWLWVFEHTNRKYIEIVRVHLSTYMAFLLTYLFIIVIGCIGNGYIILACMRNKVRCIVKLQSRSSPGLF